jgi:hypothetical protein
MPKTGVFLLADVPEENKFYLRSGKVLRNLKELSLEFHDMDDATFSHHVNAEKNDFASWIKYTIKDDALANTIENLKDKTLIHGEVDRRVSSLEKLYRGDAPVKKAKKRH